MNVGEHVSAESASSRFDAIVIGAGQAGAAANVREHEDIGAPQRARLAEGA